MPELGSTLREARIRAKIDMTEVELRTKIRARYLRAMENEEWDLLPGPVYAKSFLRTYGDFLGLDSRLLVEEFKRRHEEGVPSDELTPISPLPGEREHSRRGPRFPPWAIIGLVLIAIVAVLYAVGSGNSGSTPSPGGHAGRTVHGSAPRPSKPARPAPAPPQTVKLRLVPTAQVYVCLVNGKGKVLIPGQIFAAGQTIPTATAGRLLLTLGNASVQMIVNGAMVNVAPSSSSIGFLLSPSGSKPLPASKQPRCA